MSRSRPATAALAGLAARAAVTAVMRARLASRRLAGGLLSSRRRGPGLRSCGLLSGLLAIALLAAPAWAGGAALPAAEIAAAASPASASPPVPLLWKVSDADNAVYLLGSFHLLRGDDYPLSADIDTAFDSARRVVFEVPPEQMQDPATGEKALVLAGFGDARTLSGVLPDDLRRAFADLLAARGSSLAQLDRFEPWFVNLTLAVGLARSMGFRGEDGLDLHLMRRAALAGKATGGLETIDQQLKVLDSTPMDEQIAGLREFVDAPDAMSAQLAELHAAWRQGDVAQMDAATGREMRDKTPQTYRLLNVERNRAWLPQIRAMLDAPGRDDTLVVVGAMHLIGSDGLVEQLRGKGYRVERVCSACTDAATR